MHFTLMLALQIAISFSIQSENPISGGLVLIMGEEGGR